MYSHYFAPSSDRSKRRRRNCRQNEDSAVSLDEDSAVTLDEDSSITLNEESSIALPENYDPNEESSTMLSQNYDPAEEDSVVTLFKDSSRTLREKFGPNEVSSVTLNEASSLTLPQAYGPMYEDSSITLNEESSIMYPENCDPIYEDSSYDMLPSNYGPMYEDSCEMLPENCGPVYEDSSDMLPQNYGPVYDDSSFNMLPTIFEESSEMLPEVNCGPEDDDSSSDTSTENEDSSVALNEDSSIMESRSYNPNEDDSSVILNRSSNRPDEESPTRVSPGDSDEDLPEDKRLISLTSVSPINDQSVFPFNIRDEGLVLHRCTPYDDDDASEDEPLCSNCPDPYIPFLVLVLLTIFGMTAYMTNFQCKPHVSWTLSINFKTDLTFLLMYIHFGYLFLWTWLCIYLIVFEVRPRFVLTMINVMILVFHCGFSFGLMLLMNTYLLDSFIKVETSCFKTGAACIIVGVSLGFAIFVTLLLAQRNQPCCRERVDEESGSSSSSSSSDDDDEEVPPPPPSVHQIPWRLTPITGTTQLDTVNIESETFYNDGIYKRESTPKPQRSLHGASISRISRDSESEGWSLYNQSTDSSMRAQSQAAQSSLGQFFPSPLSGCELCEEYTRRQRRRNMAIQQNQNSTRPESDLSVIGSSRDLRNNLDYTESNWVNDQPLTSSSREQCQECRNNRRRNRVVGRSFPLFINIVRARL